MSTLDKLRKEIDSIDNQLMDLLNKRYELTNQIGKIKQNDEIEITNKDREEEILVKSLDYKNQKAIEKVYKEIMNVSKDMQKHLTYLLTKDASYTYSPMIHSFLGNDYYIPLENTSLEEFINNDEIYFKGVNITNPYKKDAYQYVLDKGFEIDEYANQTKVINFVLNGKVKKAFNTDYLGFKAMLEYYNIDLNDKNVLILGNGSTSSTVQAVLKEYKLKSLCIAVRTIRNDGEVYLKDLKDLSYVDIIINTTSYGVYPNIELDSLINIKESNVSLVIDVNYNPNRSSLSIDNPNIKYINGLYMLVEQARLAEELIQEKAIDSSNTSLITSQVLKNTINLCLIGMPFSGKTTIAQKLSAKLGKTFYDSDIILKEENLSLAKLLSLGLTIEDYRYYEKTVIETLAYVPNSVISTGGGIIEDIDNIKILKQKGLIIFIDTPFDILKERIKNDRPLVKNEHDLFNLYNKRYESYKQHCDIIVNGAQDVDSIVLELEAKLNEYFNN